MSTLILKIVAFCMVLPLTYLIVPSALEPDPGIQTGQAVPYTISQLLFRHAYRAFQQQRFTESTGLWRRVVAEEPGNLLADHAYFYLGRSLLESGRPAQAREVLETLSQQFQHSMYQNDVAVLIADSYYAQGDYETAIQRYRAISTLKTYKNHAWLPEVLFKLGICYEHKAQWSEAWKTYHESRLRFVNDPLYATLKSSEEALAAAHPEVLKTYSLRTQLQDAETLLKYGRARDALAILAPLTEQELSASDHSRVLLKLGQTYYGLRENEQALACFEEFLDRFPDSTSVPYVWDRIGRLHLRQQNLTAFEAVYAHLTTHYPQNGYTAAAIRLKGKELQLLGEYAEALQEYALFLQWYPKSSLVPEILWYIGWTHYQALNYREALTTLNRLIRAYPKSQYRDEALYWAGMAAERVKTPAEAAALYQRIRQTAPHSYYGLLAHEALSRLRQQFADLNISQPTPSSDPLSTEEELTFTTGPGQHHALAAQELAELELYDLAANEFAFAIDLDTPNQWKYLELARLYALAGMYYQQVRVIQGQFWKWLVTGDESVPEEFWRLAYPQGFASMVHQNVSGSELDPLLVYAIMFAESVFDPHAYSPAGARGLMQLMPYTGARMAGRAGIPAPEPSHYFQPDINIALGITYLTQLFDLFGGRLAPVVASYNAGETVVSTWWKPEHQTDQAAFIAGIPYRETKNYVQKVFWYYQEYQRIYSSEP